jgi:hypothetical protein
MVQRCGMALSVNPLMSLKGRVFLKEAQPRLTAVSATMTIMQRKALELRSPSAQPNAKSRAQ